VKHFLWFVLGVIGGFVAAHYVNKDPRGRDVLAELDARISEFTDRIADAYHAQEAAFAGSEPPVEALAGDDASDRPSSAL
jgi:hypothetical protein